MSMKDLLGKLAQIDESMKSAEKKPTGPKFVGKMKGTDPASARYSKYVGSAEESILKDLEKALIESPTRDLMREFKEFKENSSEYVLYINGKPASKYNNLGQAEQDVIMVKQRIPNAKFEIKQEVCKLANVPSKVTESFIESLTETFNSKQEVIDHFVKQGKSAAAGAAAWERGWRGAKAKPTNMKDFKFKKPPVKNWQELDEYGGVGGYGAASQAPAGTTARTPDPAEQQAKLDQAQIQKSTNALAGQLNSQGAAQNLNKVKFSDTMTKLDDQPNTDLNAQELKQLEPLAVATSKALQNPQTANQMKQLISKSDTMDKQKELKVKQQQQQTQTTQPAGQTITQPAQQPSAGQTK